MGSKGDLISVASNSCSVSISDESEIAPAPKKRLKKASPKKKRTGYPLRKCHVPRRCFEHVQRRLNSNRPVIELKTETIEKTNCNRFISAQINGNGLETVSAESITRLMQEMKNCLQRRDYCDLSKLISVFTQMPLGKARWHPTVLKYCLIVLLYDPLVQGTGLLDLFLEGVIGCRSEMDKKEFLKDINRLPTNIHVTKFDDLWQPYATPNQPTQQTVDQLCEVLDRQINFTSTRDGTAATDDDDDSDNWESYDENESDDGNTTVNETTEAEQVCDLNDEMSRLQEKFVK